MSLFCHPQCPHILKKIIDKKHKNVFLFFFSGEHHKPLFLSAFRSSKATRNKPTFYRTEYNVFLLLDKSIEHNTLFFFYSLSLSISIYLPTGSQSTSNVIYLFIYQWLFLYLSYSLPVSIETFRTLKSFLNIT